MSLERFARNEYSQNGEDGIIEEIFRRIGPNTLNKFCCEFGAWDGVYLSNTASLIRDKGFSGILIEGNPRKVRELGRNFPEERVKKICRFISFDGRNSLDNTLKEFDSPKDLDFLSIDVDGVDYWIWESLIAHRPKVVCIEYNPTIPEAVRFVQEKSMGVKHGSSALAILHLGHSKGYRLVSATRTNLIFVREEEFDRVLDKEPHLPDVLPEEFPATYVFTGYDGTVLCNFNRLLLPWHGVEVELSSKLQVMPKFLRRFPSDYGLARRFLFLLWLTKVFPSRLFFTIKSKLVKITSR